MSLRVQLQQPLFAQPSREVPSAGLDALRRSPTGRRFNTRCSFQACLS